MSDDDLRRVTRERDLAVARFVLTCKAMNQCMCASLDRAEDRA